MWPAPTCRPILAVLLLIGACAEDPVIAARIRAVHDGELAPATVLDDPTLPKRLELALASGATSWCPGARVREQLRAILHAGEHALRTPARPVGGQRMLVGNLPYNSVDVTVKAGALEADWTLAAPPQPGDLLAGTTTFAARLLRDPAITATLQVPISFDCDQAVEFVGRAGRKGSNAGRGEEGEAGLEVLVAVTYLNVKPGQRVAFVKAIPSAGAPAYFFLAPGRRLAIDARGGDGGAGGDGVFELQGGLGGDGGDGGRVEVRFDRRYPELKALIGVNVAGGRGGAAGTSEHGREGIAGRAGRAGRPAHFEAEDVTKLFSEEMQAGLPILKPTPGTDA